MLPGTLFQYAPPAFQCYNMNSYSLPMSMSMPMPPPDSLQQRANNAYTPAASAATASASPLYQSLFAAAAASQAAAAAATTQSQLQQPQYTGAGQTFGAPAAANNNGYEAVSQQLKLGAYGYAPPRGGGLQFAGLQSGPLPGHCASTAPPPHSHAHAHATGGGGGGECAPSAPSMDVKMAINMNMNMNMDLKGSASAYGGAQYAGGAYCAPGLGVNLMGGVGGALPRFVLHLFVFVCLFVY